jgi:hypothetical protein
MRRSVHQPQLGLERGDAKRRLSPMEIAFKCLRLECLLGQLLEVGGLLVGHLLVAAHVVRRFHDAPQPPSHFSKFNISQYAPEPLQLPVESAR